MSKQLQKENINTITYEAVWNNCLKIIKDNISLQAYKTWFEPIEPV
ncbi:MAG: DnaA N-terminal domain, partial [Bacteroidota bacterium]